MSLNPRVAVYLRVSTESQTHDSQRAELQDYFARRGWTNVRWFSDTGSGTRQDRAGLSGIMDQVRRGKVDVVVCFKLDRLARSLSHLAQIIAELQANKVALICPHQGIDTSSGNPASQFQLNILAAVAEFEKELILERVRAGVKAAKQRGVRLGRPSLRQRYINEARVLVSEGVSAAEIGRRLGIPSSTAREVVRELKIQLRASVGGAA